MTADTHHAVLVLDKHGHWNREGVRPGRFAGAGGRLRVAMDEEGGLFGRGDDPTRVLVSSVTPGQPAFELPAPAVCATVSTARVSVTGTQDVLDYRVLSR